MVWYGFNFFQTIALDTLSPFFTIFHPRLSVFGDLDFTCRYVLEPLRNQEYNFYIIYKCKHVIILKA